MSLWDDTILSLCAVCCWHLFARVVYMCATYVRQALDFFSQVSDLIRMMQAAYMDTLEELNWMDTASKEKAREKVGG